MKKHIAFLLSIVILFLCSCQQEEELHWYDIIPTGSDNPELLALSQEKHDVIYEKKDVINDIMNVYIPDELMSVMGRFFTLEDIRGILPICDVEKEDHGFNLVVYMENETFVIVTDNTGYVVYMMYYPKQLYKSWKFLRIRVGMSLDDVKNIFPCFILYEKAPHILTSEYVLYDTARIEILFSDGKAGIICLEKENGEYYVSDKYYRYQSITDDIIDSLPQGN